MLVPDELLRVTLELLLVEGLDVLTLELLLVEGLEELTLELLLVEGREELTLELLLVEGLGALTLALLLVEGLGALTLALLLVEGLDALTLALLLVEDLEALVLELDDPEELEDREGAELLETDLPPPLDLAAFFAAAGSASNINVRAIDSKIALRFLVCFRVNMARLLSLLVRFSEIYVISESNFICLHHQKNPKTCQKTCYGAFYAPVPSIKGIKHMSGNTISTSKSPFFCILWELLGNQYCWYGQTRCKRDKDAELNL